jgi:hypothetical protein
MKDKKHVPIIGTIRGARALPIPIQTLCIASDTFSGGMGHDLKEQSLLDFHCCIGASMFDAERGAFVCDEHGGAICQHESFNDSSGCSCNSLRWQKAHRQNPFNYCTTKEQSPQRALEAINWIEMEMCALYFREHPLATSDSFKTAKPRMWEEVGEMLTYQVRLSTAQALGRSDN